MRMEREGKPARVCVREVSGFSWKERDQSSSSLALWAQTWAIPP